MPLIIAWDIDLSIMYPFNFYHWGQSHHKSYVGMFQFTVGDVVLWIPKHSWQHLQFHLFPLPVQFLSMYLVKSTLKKDQYILNIKHGLQVFLLGSHGMMLSGVWHKIWIETVKPVLQLQQKNVHMKGYGCLPIRFQK
jgi:hypothetical protein